MASETIERARNEVVAACRRLAAEGLLIGTAGNVSLRTEDLVAVTATGALLAEITAAQVAVVDLTGRMVAGEFAPTSELDLHLGVYQRYRAGAVVHTHAPMATALSCVLDELPCVHYQMLALGGTVRVAPYATFGTAQLAELVLTALDGRAAALLANHGMVTHGDTLNRAVEHALLLEWACGVYWHAAALGTPRVLDERQQAAVIEAVIGRNYGSTPRVQETEPR
jgi:L-fuculose-phosphate aldolase